MGQPAGGEYGVGVDVPDVVRRLLGPPLRNEIALWVSAMPDSRKQVEDRTMLGRIEDLANGAARAGTPLQPKHAGELAVSTGKPDLVIPKLKEADSNRQCLEDGRQEFSRPRRTRTVGIGSLRWRRRSRMNHHSSLIALRYDSIIVPSLDGRSIQPSCQGRSRNSERCDSHVIRVHFRLDRRRN